MSIFTQDDADRLLNVRLMRVVRNLFPKTELDDGYILAKIQSEEATASRELRTFFEPTEVIPDGFTQDQITALQADRTGLAAGATDPVPYIVEAGYDYDPSLFTGNSWGMLSLRHGYVITLRSMTFNYPQPNDLAYTIPLEWIRVERRPGIVNLVPANGSTTLPLNAWLLSVLGGGLIVPQMIQVSYRCGLTNARGDFPDLIDLIYKRAVISIIEDEFLPQSGSLSADSFSQSISLEVDKFREQTDKKLAKLRSVMQGIVVMAM